MIHVLLADDHITVLEGVAAFLEKKPENKIKVVATASTGLEAIQQLQQQPVDVLILDIEMPGLNGIEALKRIYQANPKTKVVIMSMHKRKEFIRAAMDAGARGYVLKERSLETLVAAVHAVYAGKKYFSPEVLDLATSADTPSTLPDPKVLTETQKRVLYLYAGKGLRDWEAAELLSVSKNTVKRHVANARLRLGIKNKVALSQYVLSNDFSEFDDEFS